MEVLSNPIAAQVVSIIVAGVCGWLAAQLRGIKRRDEALYAGMRALLRGRVIDAYEDHIIEGRPMSVERKESAHRVYLAYKELGGNGVVSSMHDAIMAVPVKTSI